MLNVKNIKLNMTARTKEEVIEELTDLLIQDGAVTNKEDFIRDVWLREELGKVRISGEILLG
ncbi:PTS sugar transporter subunit IIA [Klebsiella pneumoniae]|nr:PTS sugar transporter subunit IIA [Klebsiella pneumoniae]HBS6305580.1 PTS sugar transporter subunit IIA [Klebsiella pneumoniae]